MHNIFVSHCILLTKSTTIWSFDHSPFITFLKAFLFIDLMSFAKFLNVISFIGGGCIRDCEERRWGWFTSIFFNFLITIVKTLFNFFNDHVFHFCCFIGTNQVFFHLTIYSQNLTQTLFELEHNKKKKNLVGICWISMKIK